LETVVFCVLMKDVAPEEGGWGRAY